MFLFLVICKIYGKFCNFDEIFKIDMKKMIMILLKRLFEKGKDLYEVELI